jgi:hypothetical protein
MQVRFISAAFSLGWLGVCYIENHLLKLLEIDYLIRGDRYIRRNEIEFNTAPNKKYGEKMDCRVTTIAIPQQHHNLIPSRLANNGQPQSRAIQVNSN